MVNSAERIVIVGAGHAGGAFAANLRQYGFKGQIDLVGNEERLPYQRPPLSKTWLTESPDQEALSLRPDSFYAQKDINLHLSSEVMHIDRANKKVKLSSGKALAYDYLVLACGARPRQLPIEGGHLDGVHYLRTVNDADRLKTAIQGASHLAVVGGGFIGLEVAASARMMGVEVTVIEQQERLLSRLASPYSSSFFAGLHQSRGVNLILGAQVQAFHGREDRLEAVQFEGQKLDCDAVLVGIGSVPNIMLAKQAGLDCDRGVLVDQLGRTSDPYIMAIGDMTQRPVQGLDESVCLESVPGALEQAKIVAALLAGRDQFEEQTPWFWSDQYDVKYQVVGIPGAGKEFVLRGEIENGSFSVFHFSDEQLVAVESINAARDFMMMRRAMDKQQTVNAELLADNSQQISVALA